MPYNEYIGMTVQTQPSDISSDASRTKIHSESGELEILEKDFYESGLENDMVSKDVYGPVNLIDDVLPDMLLKVRDKTVETPKKTPSLEECENAKKINWGVFTSTWLSVSAKNIDIRESLSTQSNILMDSSSDIYHRDMDEVDDEAEPKTITTTDDAIQPFCNEVPTSLLIPDHLEGVKMRRYLHMASESGLKEALQGK